MPRGTNLTDMSLSAEKVRLSSVSQKCPVFEFLTKIVLFSMILKGEPGAKAVFEFDQDDFELYAILVNAEVERSFSILKNVITNRRRSLSDKTAKEYSSLQYSSPLLETEKTSAAWFPYI